MGLAYFYGIGLIRLAMTEYEEIRVFVINKQADVAIGHFDDVPKPRLCVANSATRECC